MQITVEVKDKDVKTAVAALVDDEIYNNFDPATLKAVKMPAKTTLIKQLMDDEDYMYRVTKQMAEALTNEAVREINYAVSALFPKDIEALIAECHDIDQKTTQQAFLDDILDTRLDDVLNALMAMGYYIEKPKGT